MRQRTIAALLGSGLTVRDAHVFLGTDPVVIIQLAVDGTEEARRAVAAKLIGSLGRHSPCLRQEPDGVTVDEVYLAAGYTAEVHELSPLRQ